MAAAILAASAHNTQPWLFGITDDRIDLFADLSRATGANDPLDRELFVSLGCALENLAIAAPTHGLRSRIELRDDGEHVAVVRLEAGPTVESSLYQAIGERHSNRSEFRATPISAATMDEMSALVDDSVAPARLVWLVGDDAQRFGDLLVEATRAHVADDEQSIASFAWWRNDWDAIQRHKDGLTVDGVGLSPLVRTIAKILPGTSRAAADETFVERTEIQARSAAAFGVIVVDDPLDRRQQLAGGRLLQRLHLWAAANGLGFQHMNQITERIDRDTHLGRPAAFDQVLRDLAGPGTLAAFRVGIPKVGASRSPRRPVEEVVR